MGCGKVKTESDLSCFEIKEIIELVNEFLFFADKLLEDELISKMQYDEITYKKIEFLKYVHDK